MKRVFNDLMHVKGQKKVLDQEDVKHYYKYVDSLKK